MAGAAAPFLEVRIGVKSRPSHSDLNVKGCYLCDDSIPHKSTPLFQSLVVAAKTHKQRHHQSDQYHYRVQKKWDSRFASRPGNLSEIRSVASVPLKPSKPFLKIVVDLKPIGEEKK